MNVASGQQELTSFLQDMAGGLFSMENSVMAVHVSFWIMLFLALFMLFSGIDQLAVWNRTVWGWLKRKHVLFGLMVLDVAGVILVSDGVWHLLIAAVTLATTLLLLFRGVLAHLLLNLAGFLVALVLWAILSLGFMYLVHNMGNVSVWFGLFPSTVIVLKLYQKELGRAGSNISQSIGQAKSAWAGKE